MLKLKMLTVWLIIICNNVFANENEINPENESILENKCISCHSLKIIQQQRLSESRWKEIILLMYKEHGMTKLTKSEYEETIEYLSKYYGE